MNHLHSIVSAPTSGRVLPWQKPGYIIRYKYVVLLVHFTKRKKYIPNKQTNNNKTR